MTVSDHITIDSDWDTGVLIISGAGPLPDYHVWVDQFLPTSTLTLLEHFMFSFYSPKFEVLKQLVSRSGLSNLPAIIYLECTTMILFEVFDHYVPTFDDWNCVIIFW